MAQRDETPEYLAAVETESPPGEPDLQVRSRRVDDFAEPSAGYADYVGEAFSEEFGATLRDLGTQVVEHVRSVRRHAESARDDVGFETRYARNARRQRNVAKPTTDSHGSVDERAEDGHAFMGITQGLSRQASQTVAAFMHDVLFVRPQRPYAVEAKGRRPEGPDAERIAQAICDDMLDRSDFAQRMWEMCDQVPAYGTHCLRYEMGYERHMERDAQGRYHEEVGLPVPVLRTWNLEHVYVSNVDRPGATDQEAVIWRTPAVTLSELEREEAVYETNAQGEVVRATGKFRNLHALRRYRQATPDTADTDNSEESTTRVTVLPHGELYEYEGPLPIYALWEEGLLDYDVALAIGADVGDDPDPSDKEAMRDWAYRLSAIPVWQVAWVEGWSGVDSQAMRYAEPLLLRLEPDRNQRPVNSLFVFGYFNDNNRFYRFSVPDLGRKLEEKADETLNNVLYTAWKNRRPSRFINRSLLKNKSEADLREFLAEPDGWMDLNVPPGQFNRESLIVDLIYEHDEQWRAKIEHLRYEFQHSTGAMAAVQGRDEADATGTWSEMSHNANMGSLKLNYAILGGVATEVARLCKRIVGDTLFWMSRADLVDYIAGLTGMGASKIVQVLPTTRRMVDELTFEHPLLAAKDATVLASLILQVYQVLGVEAFPDVQRVARAVLEVGGYRRADELIKPSDLLNPEDEQHQMSQGNRMDPHLDDRHDQHIATHLMRLEQIEAEAAAGQRLPEETQIEHGLLKSHLQDTMRMIETLVAAMGQTQPATVEQPGAAGGGAATTTAPQPARAGERPKGPERPQDGKEQAQSQRTQARQRPPSGENTAPVQEAE